MAATPSSIPTLQHEMTAGYPERIIIGVDEVGRGCLAGPVMAGAFAFPIAADSEGGHPEWLSRVRDSKLLSAKAREELGPLLEQWTPHWAVGVASVEEIDRINILHAAELAMKRAVDAVIHSLQGKSVLSKQMHVLVDGNRVPKHFQGFATAIVGGDRSSLSIACASVIAKVHRDRHLSELEHQHPGYGFAVHKGYGTPHHLEALRRLKPCAAHRQSFAPVRLSAEQT